MTTWAEPKQLSLMADPLDVRFLEFHHRNPAVYWELVRMAKQWRGAGHSACSIKMLVEVLRWQGGISTESSDGLTINNSYASRYARLIAANEPDLAHMFNTRHLRTDYEGGL